MKQEEANELMGHFQEKLEDIIVEYLEFTDITTEQVNKYYSFGNDCPISVVLGELRESDNIDS